MSKELSKVRVGRIKFVMKVKVGYIKVKGIGGKTEVKGKER